MKPNVILFAETLKQDMLVVMDLQFHKPNIDRLAAKGQRFDSGSAKFAGSLFSVVIIY